MIDSIISMYVYVIRLMISSILISYSGLYIAPCI